MEPIPVPKTLKVYMLLKQTGLSLSTAGTLNSLGTGFYSTQDEAELNRTLMALSQNIPYTSYHIFELSVPNPAYKE